MTSFIQQNQQKIQQFARENDIAYLGLFGSQARGDDKPHSDVDMVIKFKTPGGLLRRATIKLKLEQLLGINVDLISVNGINPMLKPYIEKEIIDLYETA